MIRATWNRIAPLAMAFLLVLLLCFLCTPITAYAHPEMSTDGTCVQCHPGMNPDGTFEETVTPAAISTEEPEETLEATPTPSPTPSATPEATEAPAEEAPQEVVPEEPLSTEGTTPVSTVTVSVIIIAAILTIATVIVFVKRKK